MDGDWALVFSSGQNHLIEIVKGLLAEHGIQAISVNKKDSMHTHLINAEIEVFVEKNNYLKARHLIEKNKL